MDPRIRQTLADVFGFPGFRPGQERIIDIVMAGRSALAVFPTGGGKSLCYQLPGTLLPGLTLVVSPLLALMKDQVDFLQSNGIAAARLDSTLSFEQTREVYARVRSGELKLLYVAPERVFNERFLAGVAGVPIDLLVVDEAHCISEWGHNFRPEYLKLAAVSKTLRAARVLALTATATPPVAKDICREFEIGSSDHVNTGFYRPNLKLAFSPTDSRSRGEALVQRLRSRPAEPTVVYVTLQKTAEEVAAALQASGLDVKAYHAGMKSEERDAVQDWFMKSASAIVVATIAFGMGIDKSDIRGIYHYNLPKTLENYAQEIGRAGRDGNDALCELLGSGEDLVTLQNFIFGDTPEPENVKALLRRLMEMDSVFDVSIYELSSQFDIRVLVVRTLLTYLELDGVLKFVSPFYAEYKYRLLEPMDSILARFEAGKSAFLDKVFKNSRHNAKWSVIDLATTARLIGEERGRIVKAFQYLEETGRLEVQASNARLTYRLLRRPNQAELETEIIERIQANESMNLERTEQMIQLLNTKGCKTRLLLRYFGEELGKDCGRCDYCETGRTIPISQDGAVAEVDRAAMESALGRAREALGSARQQARFLCGISSPALVRSKLTKDPDFGIFGKLPFRAVLHALEGAPARAT